MVNAESAEKAVKLCVIKGEPQQGEQGPTSGLTHVSVCEVSACPQSDNQSWPALGGHIQETQGFVTDI